ncbi:hypothetical protein ADE_11630 [Achromobacter denitrificans]|uniref:hypothetical protein n=1 Tax=Achromobacter denitrificans TaxID=32002 RepID=UPI000A492848|nr:hypothetical protein [Achromobacter denitrificans]GFN25465.1 hypothetical protein ADE_11630 [Achromobacter denitrificans]
MALYFLSYDLRKSRNYQPLYDALAKLGATRVLESLWAITHADTNCETVRNYFRQFIDADDGLIVTQAVDWATWNVDKNPPNT